MPLRSIQWMLVSLLIFGVSPIAAAPRVRAVATARAPRGVLTRLGRAVRLRHKLIARKFARRKRARAKDRAMTRAMYEDAKRLIAAEQLTMRWTRGTRLGKQAVEEGIATGAIGLGGGVVITMFGSTATQVISLLAAGGGLGLVAGAAVIGAGLKHARKRHMISTILSVAANPKERKKLSPLTLKWVKKYKERKKREEELMKMPKEERRSDPLGDEAMRKLFMLADDFEEQRPD